MVLHNFASSAQTLQSQVVQGFGGRGTAFGDDVDIHAACLRRQGGVGDAVLSQHVLKTAVALLDPHQTLINWSHMPDDLVEELRDLAMSPQDEPQTPPQNLNELSRKAIENALENCLGNVTAAAKQLGISRQTLYRHLKTKQAG